MALPAGEDASRYLESRTLFFPNRDWLFLWMVTFGMGIRHGQKFLQQTEPFG